MRQIFLFILEQKWKTDKQKLNPELYVSRPVVLNLSFIWNWKSIFYLTYPGLLIFFGIYLTIFHHLGLKVEIVLIEVWEKLK